MNEKELYEAAKEIKKYCKEQCCEKCVFFNKEDDSCKINTGGYPFDWEVEK